MNNNCSQWFSTYEKINSRANTQHKVVLKHAFRSPLPIIHPFTHSFIHSVIHSLICIHLWSLITGQVSYFNCSIAHRPDVITFLLFSLLMQCHILRTFYYTTLLTFFISIAIFFPIFSLSALPLSLFCLFSLHILFFCYSSPNYLFRPLSLILPFYLSFLFSISLSFFLSHF